MTGGLDEFRATVRAWCEQHIPRDWRQAQTGVADEEFVRFQKSWFQELHSAGFAVPHWPAEWGGGMSVPSRSCCTRSWPPTTHRGWCWRSSIHHAASTLLAAGTDEQRRRHLPAILDGEIWVQGFSEPEAGSDLASLVPRHGARRLYVVNGQKLWASGAKHADWCLLLARTDPDAPKRRGISYFLLDMRTPGIEVRPIRKATGESHFCEMFLDDVSSRPKTSSGRERRLAGGAGDAGRRTRHDHAGAGRAAGQRGVPVARGGRARLDDPSCPTGWRSSRPSSPGYARCAEW